MSHFKLVLAVLAAPVFATPVVAERILDRAEIEQVLTQSALCYALNDGPCVTGEFYTQNDDRDIMVFTAFKFAGRLLVLGETLLWDGDTLCLPQDASGLTQAWRQDDPDTFVFDFAASEPMTDAFLSSQRDYFTQNRTGDYCYGFVVDGDGLDGLRPYSASRDLADVGVRLVPLAKGSLSLQ